MSWKIIVLKSAISPRGYWVNTRPHLPLWQTLPSAWMSNKARQSDIYAESHMGGKRGQRMERKEGIYGYWCHKLRPRVLCNIEYPTETPLKLKSPKISCTHKISFIYPFVLKFCTEHDSDTALLCTEFQNDWSTETCLTGKRDFMRFAFKMHFRRISHIAQGPWGGSLLLLSWINFNLSINKLLHPIKCGMKSLTAFKDAPVEVWEWIDNSIPHFTGYMITYPNWD